MIPVGHFRFEFAHSAPAGNLRYLGSAWRGVLGHELRRRLCTAPGIPCKSCKITADCRYFQFFESSAETATDLLKAGAEVPPPYILRSVEAQPNRPYALHLTLFGASCELLPELRQAIRSGGEAGLDGVGSPFRLLRILQEAPAGSRNWTVAPVSAEAIRAAVSLPELPPPVPAAVRVHLNTFLRLRVRGHYLGPADFTFAPFFSNLIRRLSLLSQFHGSGPLQADFAGLVRLAASVSVNDAALRWAEWSRFSNRQQTRVPMGGLLGSFTLDGAPLAQLWPWLWHGQFTHVGKGASMGLGHYLLEALEC